MKVTRIFLFVICFIFCFLSIMAYVKWKQNFIFVDKSVRPFFSSVMKEYYLSNLTGGYWINTVREQTELLQRYSQKERVTFFRGILINCDFMTSASNSVIFMENIGNDAKALKDDIIQLKSSKLGKQLTGKQLERIDLWSSALDDVILEYNEKGNDE